MEELKDTSIHHTALKLSEDIKNMKIYNNLFKTVQVFSSNLFKFFEKLKNVLLQKLACAPTVDKDDLKSTLEQAMKTNGLETDIRNIVFHLIRSSIKSDGKSAISAVSPLKDPGNYLNDKNLFTE